ncbi:MAG: hypothetical protein H7124_10785 [Phycisphaerales bacterium]|nr:hypothetical protein [Hyphomonadaceae bacterium]
MRRAILVLALALAACGQQQEPPPPPSDDVTIRVPPPWFICDAINAPAIFVFNRTGETVQVAEYEKPTGAILSRNGYVVGPEEGAAGNVFMDIYRDEGTGGEIRRSNPDVLETPGSAYTTVFTSVELDRRNINCRWMPRTRVLGFTGRRSFVVHEDASGDLIYTAYNFVDAANARPIELSENGRTTTPFSVEVRDGAEAQTAEGVTYTFETQGFRYVVALNRDGTGTLDVSSNGVAMQTEDLLGYQQGTAQAQAQ